MPAGQQTYSGAPMVGTAHRLTPGVVCCDVDPNKGLGGNPVAVTNNGGITPTYVSGGHTSIDPTQANTFFINAAGGNTTLDAANAGTTGQEVTLVIKDSGGRTVTFGTNFRMTASTIVGTDTKVMVVRCVSDGTNLIEISRTTAIT